MIEFIDMRGFELDKNFAYWNTDIGHFIEFSGNNAWNTWKDFETDFLKTWNGPNSFGKIEKELKQYKMITPQWTFQLEEIYKNYYVSSLNVKSLIGTIPFFKARDVLEVRKLLLKKMATDFLIYWLTHSITILCFSVIETKNNTNTVVGNFNFDFNTIFKAVCDNFGYIRKIPNK